MIERIFILHHTHVDFGYTDSREKVCKDLIAMVDCAIDLVSQSMNRPAPQRFRWIHEVSWPVLEYLRTGGKQTARLFEQMRQGYQELTAFYVNPTDLFDRDSFTHSIDQAYELASQHKLPLTTAMFGDCPGIAWSIVDILAERGIKYLSAAPDFIMSYPLEIERPFYWEGPNGNRVLTWFTDWRNFWYAEGLSALKLTEDLDGASGRLNDYLRKLENEGYRWKGLAIHVAMDNVFPSPQLMDFVARFNVQNTDRQVQMAANCDFFEFMEKEHRDQFPICRGAWPDWWANGSGSAAYETACSRRAKCSLRRAKALAKATGVEFDQAKYDDALEDILQFDEHTWGHSTSVKDPSSAIARVQWAQKRTFAVNGYLKALGLENVIAGKIAEAGKVVVRNPLDSDWMGLVCLKAEGEKATCLSDSESPILIEGQYHRGKDYFCLTVPAGGTRRFTRSPSDSPPITARKTLENDRFRLKWNSTTGAVEEIFDKVLRFELTDPDAKWHLGELIYERVPSGSREAIYDIKQGSNNTQSKRPRPTLERTGDRVEANHVQLFAGPVFDGLITAGEVPGARFEREVRLLHGVPRIDVVLRLDKQVNTTYESLYLAFPFAFDCPAIWIENAGAVYRAGIEQLPGSATDWHSVGHYAAVSDCSRTVVLVPHDVPLVQVSDIQTGKWAKTLDVISGHLYSWVMNNLWFTNFPAYQEGKVELTWSLTTQPGPFDAKFAEAFSHDVRIGVAVATVRPEDQSVVW